MKKLAEAKEVVGLIETLAEQIASAMAVRGSDSRGWALVGVRNRGDKLAERVAELVGESKFEGRVGAIDITLYRDDLSEVGAQPMVQSTEIGFDLDGVDVVLVDDVLMTGRSVRAALSSLMDFGRPRRVWLAVLVDRGGRELPIAADFVGLDLSDGKGGFDVEHDHVQVRLMEVDDKDEIEVLGS
ncbi:bifunctional pyr operon transcriptional regulator/uracil phosphoribosyltransferase PyrR [Poriferisphaera sp. WC338]|uniref:bifunctional pyr operon transcriptional regulator/uracil phosphoribosyltransferase PyrR n=1 Tax=Poriferisphaera sp. WC338 TaxID=3425129 RepID=UPI003D81980E